MCVLCVVQATAHSGWSDLRHAILTVKSCMSACSVLQENGRSTHHACDAMQVNHGLPIVYVFEATPFAGNTASRKTMADEKNEGAREREGESEREKETASE